MYRTNNPIFMPAMNGGYLFNLLFFCVNNIDKVKRAIIARNFSIKSPPNKRALHIPIAMTIFHVFSCILDKAGNNQNDYCCYRKSGNDAHRLQITHRAIREN